MPTAEEFHKALQPIVDPNVSEELLMRYAQAKAPGVDVIERDPTQRQHRAEISRKMREAMVSFLEAINQAWMDRDQTALDELPRELSIDTLLLLPHSEQNKEYERRCDILVNGTPKQKKELLFNALREAKQDYTAEKLYALTDEEIAADFENLHRLKQFASSAVKISETEFLELSPDEKKELLDFEKEFQFPSGAIFARAKLVSAPYYELLHPERIPESGGAQVDEMTEDDKEMNALAEVETCVSTYQGVGLRNPWMEIVQTQGLDGFQSEEVTWLDQDGAEIHRRDPRGKILPMVEPPVGELMHGKPLFAMLPNGETKVFFPSQPEGSRITLKNEPLSVYMMDKRNPALLGKLSGSMDKQLPGAINDLSNSLKKVDHWYIRSSQAFKDVRADLEKMQEEWRALGPNPTKYQRDRLREQMLELDAHCAEYIDNKNRKEKLNDRDKERLAAIKAVSKFAKKQIASLRILESRAEVHAEIQRSKEKAEEKAAFQEAQSQERREARKEGKLPEEEVKKFEERTKANAEAGLERLAETQLLNLPKTMVGQYEKYRNMTLPKSDAGNGASELSQRITKQIGHLSHKQLSEQEVKSSGPMLMRDILILDAVLNERAENKFKREGDPAGVYEGLTNGPDYLKWLQNAIEETPAFKKMTDKLTPDSLNDFIMKRNVKETLGEVFHDIQKSAAKVNDKRREEVEREAAELKQYGEIKTIGSVTELGDQIAAYKRLQCPASKWGDELDSMRRQVISMLNEQSWRQDVHESFIRRNMAKGNL